MDLLAIQKEPGYMPPGPQISARYTAGRWPAHLNSQHGDFRLPHLPLLTHSEQVSLQDLELNIETLKLVKATVLTGSG